ncbi:hypothetical protein FK531_07475 [Rhodococcus spelaei]|uniref:Uncharacterized protein n=1 Tax=Rhodococcus spelaei TaxID=2546320 RepID=A0A541BM48_9NOCA|nr:S-4TM family putative pore-forming effector [Rhodococcus spelaei]TQF73344.1 hypothetical protein FK531_07475 [Rhodococcus spelaei]
MTPTNPHDYSAPSSASMLRRQNEQDALRLLIAQRRIHSKAKFWQSLRWTGLLLIGLAAPVISAAWPGLAVLMGAIAGGWLFLGRTALEWRISALTTRAAATQEAFDFFVFAMPRTVIRSTLPSIEDISKLAGPDAELLSVADREELLGWYPINEADSNEVAVAIAQRANASYSDRLLRTTVTLWIASSIVWGIALVVLSVIAKLPLPTFLAGVLLPVLPASLDVVEYIVSIRRAARDRGDLARSIEGRLTNTSGQALEGQDLLVWQDRMFELRRSTPQVPDLLYRLTRRSNEAAMKSAADQLGRHAREFHG